MKIIALAGDSHTFGEGVGGEHLFNPPCVSGDLRKLPFSVPCYANLLGEYLNLTTGSSAVDYSEQKLCALFSQTDDQCGVITAPFEITESFQLCRVFFRCETEKARVTLSVDGTPVCTKDLAAQSTAYRDSLSAAVVFSEGDRPHVLTIAPAPGCRVLLQRLEFYRGEYAVVNCGFGSCPVGKFNDLYFDEYLTALKPWAVVCEGNTINDWLTENSLSEYETALTEHLSRCKALTPRVFLQTVFPIRGEQKSRNGVNTYDEFIAVARKAAGALGVPVADSNQTMKDYLSHVPPEHHERVLYHDGWHPNGLGHVLYAKDLITLLKNYL